MSTGVLRRDLYEGLGNILETEGDDGFITNGPKLVQRAFSANPSLFNGLRFVRAENNYTRAKVIGEEGRHVILAMEWAPGFYLLPHEHHGRPCFDFVIQGHLRVTDYEANKINGNKRIERYRLTPLRTYGAKTGNFVVVNPSFGEIHSVKTIEKSRSIHFYPGDNAYSFGYERLNGTDTFIRKKISLKHD